MTTGIFAWIAAHASEEAATAGEKEVTPYWRTLKSDPDAKFDLEVRIDAATIVPHVTWGTSPEDALPITGNV